MPNLGQTTAESRVTSWLKHEGDRIERGEPLAEVETDKATVPVESHSAGYVRRILADAGTVVNSGELIALLTSTADEAVEAEQEGAVGAELRPVVQRSTFNVQRDELAPQQAPASRVDATRSAAAGAVRERDVEPRVQRGPAPDPELLTLYETMLRIRRFEETVSYLFLQGEMPGTIHLYIGQEAVATGVCAALYADDYVVSTHRAHGHAIAKGVSVDAMMAELFGRTTGCCGGKGGSMHVGDMRVGMPPSIAVVGAGIPIAAGLALAAKQKRTGQVAVSFFGDGAANEGTFHEGINIAAVWDLPVIFVCENNQYGASTHVSKVMKVQDVAARAGAYGIPGVVVDGNDVLAVYEATTAAVHRARDGGGPTLLECKTYRQAGHSRTDPGSYRAPGEADYWRQRDPIACMRELLLENHMIDETGLEIIDAAIELELENAIAYARSSPEPEPAEIMHHVYSES